MAVLSKYERENCGVVYRSTRLERERLRAAKANLKKINNPEIEPIVDEITALINKDSKLLRRLTCYMNKKKDFLSSAIVSRGVFGKPVQDMSKDEYNEYCRALYIKRREVGEND